MPGLLSRWNFLRRPAHEAIPHHEVRYVAATKRENTKAARKQAETTAALNRIVTEQRLVAAVGAATSEPVTESELATGNELFAAEQAIARTRQSPMAGE